MNIFIEETKFIEDLQIDINYLNLQRFDNPVIIATREAQIHRILEWSDRTNYQEKFSILGWWELMGKGYLCNNGIVCKQWHQHNAIFFLDPNRCSNQALYSQLILLCRTL